MKVTRLVTLVLSLSVILSCGDVSVKPESEASSPNSTISFQENTAESSELPPISFGNENSIIPVAAASGPVLNPRHGEPGHRCDIAVGQPLINQTAIQPIVSYNSPLATVVPPTANTINLHPAPILNPNLRTVANAGANFSSNTSTGVLNPRHGEPGHRCDIPVGSPLNSAPSTASTSSTITPTTTQPAVGPGLNPKHGEPGHRCDIAVGQPLNSKPATTSTSSPVTSPTTSTPSTTEAAVAPGMNPKHGQPGHRCDIGVGQPLNSKPATTSPSSPVTSTTTTPTTTQAAVAPGMNPKHGQPGHRCDIAVGQPLNSTPSTAAPAPATSATDTPSTITPATNNVAVATGLNPKHGQPGHRCDIASGQPLNSTPPKTSPVPATSPTETSSITPTTKGAAAALGLNPKHGQPGHRCDIPVGSPLKGKPAQK